MTPDSGRLNRLVEIKSKGTTLDAYGEPDFETRSLVATIWAEELSIDPAEKFAGASDQPFQKTKFRIRYREDIDEDMVVEYDGYGYDITGIHPEGHRHRQWLIVSAMRNEVVGITYYNLVDDEGNNLVDDEGNNLVAA